MEKPDPYSLVFYLCYRWSQRINGKRASNVYLASLMLSVIVFLNIITVMIVMDRSASWGLNPWVAGGLVLAFALANYWYFSPAKRLLEARSQFLQRLVDRWYISVPIYAGASLVALIFAGFTRLQ